MHCWTSPRRSYSTRLCPSRLRTQRKVAETRRKKSDKSSWVRPILAFGLVLTIFGSGVLVGRSHDRKAPRTPPSDLGANFEPFWETWNLVEKHYVGRNITNRQQLTRGAIKGLLDSLGDPEHTHFQTKEEFEHYVKFMNGEGHGIGVRLQMAHHQPRILETLPGSPARAAGLQVGDVITAVDGSDPTGLPLGQVLALIRGGSAGSSVHLDVRRAGQDHVLSFDVCRAKENVIPVVWQMVPEKSVMHLAIRHFDKKTHRLVRAALREAQLQKAKGLILDLRSCPGGLVDEAMAVTSEFLKQGAIAIQENDEGHRTPIPVRGDGMATEIPMCVLVNKRTCSCAELMAGALKDHDRATIIGVRTAGMGTMLHPFEMSDGSVLFLAVAEWRTPKGTRIWHQGIEPTIAMQLPEGADALLPGAESYLLSKTFAKLADCQLNQALEILGPRDARVAQTDNSLAIQLPE
jgi:carboxyl-terminal processing protease